MLARISGEPGGAQWLYAPRLPGPTGRSRASSGGQPSFGRVLLGVILLGVQVVADLAALLTVRPLEGQGTDTPKVHDFQLAPVQLPAELAQQAVGWKLPRPRAKMIALVEGLFQGVQPRSRQEGLVRVNGMLT